MQLLLALSYCHSKKILHRDVKTQVGCLPLLQVFKMVAGHKIMLRALLLYTERVHDARGEIATWGLWARQAAAANIGDGKDTDRDTVLHGKSAPRGSLHK